MSRPPSRLLNLPPRGLAQARCPASRSGWSRGPDREGHGSGSRWRGCGVFWLREGRPEGLGGAAGSGQLCAPGRAAPASRRSWSPPRAGGGNKEDLLPARSSLLRFLALPPGAHTAAIWLSALWPSPRRRRAFQGGLFAVQTRGLGEQHVARQAGISEVLGPAPWLASISSCKGEASVSFPAWSPWAHLLAQPRGSTTLRAVFGGR